LYSVVDLNPPKSPFLKLSITHRSRNLCVAQVTRSAPKKQLFGKQAWAIVPHIECAEDAKDNPQPKVCTKAGIKGFPTWKIRGKLDAGVKKLAELGKLTGYQGNTDFKYDRLLK
jgi:hypothetical protein